MRTTDAPVSRARPGKTASPAPTKIKKKSRISAARAAWKNSADPRVPSNRHPRGLFHFLDFDISKPNFVAVILQQDVTGKFGAELWVGHVFEFAFGHAGQNLVASQFVLQNFRAVEPVLDMIAPNQNARLIPFS